MQGATFPLGTWEPAHAAAVTLDDHGNLHFIDTPADDFHLIRRSDPEYDGARLRLSILVRPSTECSVDLYVNHWGGIDVCRISRFGEILDRGTAESIEVGVDDAGRIKLDVVFYNGHETVLVGSSDGPGGTYPGRGVEQFVFERIDIAIAPLDEVAEEDKICLVDVGAAGGIQSIWRALRGQIRPIAFEPNPEEAVLIRAELTSFKGGEVIECGLFSQDTSRTLYVTLFPSCSSVFRPNAALLSRYAVAPAFEVVREISITCNRYDTLYQAGRAPQPDVVKIDVQGAELDVLQGFGGLLTRCLAIELETHVYPIYEGQGLLGDIIAYLDRYGFSLRKIEPQMNFDADAVEFNAYFTKRPAELPAPVERSSRKLAIIDRVWNLQTTDSGAELAAMAAYNR